MDFLLQLISDPVGFYNSHTVLIAEIGINSIAASSMFVVLYSGQLSLAAPGFMAIGAYTSVLMDTYFHTPLAVNIAAGTLLAGVVGGLVGSNAGTVSNNYVTVSVAGVMVRLPPVKLMV